MAGLTTAEQVLLFHKTERDLFHRLVHDLGKDPATMRWVIAFWLWLESLGHNNLIRRVKALPGPVVQRFVDEAVACLRCLAGPALQGAIGDTDDSRDRSLPCTNALLAKPIEDVSYFVDHREEVLDGVTYLHKSVCLIVCNIVNGTCVPASNNSASSARADPPRISSPVHPPPPMMVGPPVHASPPMMIGSHVHAAPPMMVGSSVHATTPLMMVGSPVHAAPPMMASWPPLNPMALPWVPMETQRPLPDDYRSLFITFSRGYPISREDIVEFFNSMFGPCVETVMIEKAAAGQLPVYGRVVLRSAAMLPVVLDGCETAKFLIKGKHLWARIYVPSSTLPQD